MHFAVALLSAAFSSGAMAVVVPPASYDMVNGFSGVYHYWDDLYNGSGCTTCDGAVLSGGLGDLTDGVIATSNWSTTETTGRGPYVGWWNINPSITFHFSQTVSVGSVTLSFDDAQTNGVAAPISVVIGSQSFPVTNPPGTAPFSFTASGLGFSGKDLTLVLNRGGPVTFLSEVSFSSPVPEVGSGPMALAGLSIVGWAIARRRHMPGTRGASR